MRSDPIKQYVVLKTKLLKEKVELEARLAQILRALGTDEPAAAAPARPSATRGRKRIQNPMTMKEAILRVTKEKPLSKAEIVKAVQKIGYRFAAKDPISSLSTLLYTDRAFKNHGGKFAPA